MFSQFEIGDMVFICPVPSCYSWDNLVGYQTIVPQNKPFGDEIGEILDVREEVHPETSVFHGMNYLVEGKYAIFIVSDSCLRGLNNV